MAGLLNHNTSIWNSSRGAEGFNTSGNYSLSNNTHMNDTNDSFDFSESFPNPFDKSLEFRVNFIVSYAIVFACCFFGNVVVLLVILRNTRMRSRTNFFLANLAVADLCVGLFCVIPKLCTFLSTTWFLGRVMCKVYYFVHQMSYTASITLLTVISMERYIAIMHPLKAQRLITVRRLKISLVIIWFVSAAYNVPALLIFDTVDFPSMDGSALVYCFLTMQLIDQRAYHTANFIVWYILPLMLMSFMYTRISIALWRSSSQMNINASVRKRSARGSQISRSAGSQRLTFPTKVSFSKRGQHLKTSPRNQGLGTTASIENHSTVSFGSSKRPNRQRRWGGHSRLGGFLDRTKRWAAYKVRSISMESDHDYMSDDDGETKCDRLDELADCADDMDMSMEQSLERINEQSPTSAETTVSIHDSLSVDNAEAESLSVSGKRKRSSCQSQRISGIKAPRSQRTRHSALTARKKVIRLLVAVVCSFAVCVLPYHVLKLMQNWASSTETTSISSLFPPLSFVILYLNSGLNPILYALLSDNFRRSLRETLACRRI